MATIVPQEIDLCRTRGDTFADQFTLKDENQVAIDITGFSFVLTVDPKASPPDAANNLFALTGVITDAVNGVVEFAPIPAEADQTPGTYYFDIQQTDAAAKLRTIVKGKYIFTQDISK